MPARRRYVAARRRRAAVPARRFLGVVAVLQPRDEVVDVRGLGGRDHLLLGGVGPPIAEVVRDRAREKERLTEDDAQLVAERLELQLADIVSVDKDPALVGIVETNHQAGEGRLAGTGLADDRDAYPAGRRS